MTREANGARWSSQPSKLPFEPFAGFEGGFDSHTLPPMPCYPDRTDVPPFDRLIIPA